MPIYCYTVRAKGYEGMELLSKHLASMKQVFIVADTQIMSQGIPGCS